MRRCAMVKFIGMTLGIMTSTFGAQGPDVIVGDISTVDDYARLGDKAALAMTTVSCNAGGDVLSWQALPSNQHPLIAQNFFRLKDGRLQQVGQAWLKHGFFALQTTFCYSDCEPVIDGSALGVHCSDPYTPAQNQGPDLGPRSEVNPVTGYFNGATANNHAGHAHTSISHGLQVRHADLGISGARYFVEVQYVSADDALAGNSNNNATYREVAVSGNAANWTFTPLSPAAVEQPAVMAWTGSSRSILDTWPSDGRMVVAHKITALGGGINRFDYAVYNMNSERGIRSFSVPVGGANVSNFGFSAVESHDEGFSNAPWVVSQGGGQVTWATDTFADDPNANAIRWGTMYNFWFEADTGGIGSSATLGRFKPGAGSTLLVGWIRAPAAGDCNGNGISDEQDVLAGTSADCNDNDLPDECEAGANDCNANGMPDDCDLLSGTSLDCNANAIADECDTASQRSPDCNLNSVPDECELIPDCNFDAVPDDCQLAGNDCDANLVPDDCQNDCDRDGLADPCEAAADCNLNSVPDDCDVLGLPGGTRVWESGEIQLPIPDGNGQGVSHVLPVPLGGEILDVNVEVEITHTWISDLTLTLQHGGVSVRLWDGACGSADNLYVTFDDEGGVVQCASPTAGVIAPPSSGGQSLGAFMGQDARGDWTLHLVDSIGTDAGVLQRWSLSVNTVTVPPTSPDINGTGVPDECEGCEAVAQCADASPCTAESCLAGLCWYAAFVYGDVDRSGAIDFDDILCVIYAFIGEPTCDGADLFPCQPNGLVDVDDLTAVLDAFQGQDPCCNS